MDEAVTNVGDDEGVYLAMVMERRWMMVVSGGSGQGGWADEVNLMREGAKRFAERRVSVYCLF